MSEGMLRFIVYSDYLCPWCYNASVRLRSLEAEYAGAIELDWRSYLLRPERRTHRDPAAALEKFRRYTESWLRPGAEPDSGEFQVWATNEGPPSHSVPAHLASKAAKRLGKPAFDAMHDRLLKAYFGENRDISRESVLKSLWQELGFPPGDFESASESEWLDEVLAEHREALEFGATGVPAVALAGNPAIIVGAHPVELYRRWIDRSLARLGGAEELRN
jgi:predicted DsbA family dithiol-disulfide isomerase